MTQPPNGSVIDINSRLAILQSGYRNFVSSIKIPISPDTKWLIELVCIHTQPAETDKNVSIFDKADNFLKSFLWTHQQNMNKQRQDWVQSMKNNI